MFWFGKPESSIVGIGVIAGEVDDDDPDWGGYCYDFRPLVKLKSPLTLHELRRDPIIAEWWRGNPYRGLPKTIKPPVAQRLLELISSKNTPNRKLARILATFKLAEQQTERHVTSNGDDTPPPSVEITTTRIVRDTRQGEMLKQLYDYSCQICGFSLHIPTDGGGRKQVEVHHLRPVGGSHRGLDNHSNMLVLCANCHAGFDYLALAINPAALDRIESYDKEDHPMHGKAITFAAGHVLSQTNIDYHWQRCRLAWKIR